MDRNKTLSTEPNIIYVEIEETALSQKGGGQDNLKQTNNNIKGR